MDSERDARDHRLEVEIAGRSRDRIGVHNDQGFDPARADIRNKLGKGARVVGERIGSEAVHRSLEAIVDPHAERRRIGQRGPDQHEPAPRMSFKILGDGVDDMRMVLRQRRRLDRRAEAAGKRRDHRLDRIGRRLKSVIGERAGQRHRRFDRVEATRGAIAPPPFDERPPKTNLVRSRSERIGRERDNDVRVREARP